MAAAFEGYAPQADEDHSTRNRQQGASALRALGPGSHTATVLVLPTAHLLVLVFQNLKRQQLDEERYSSIERANYLLLERMSHIMTHPQTVDMKQSLPPPKSLNKDGRKKELMRITEENHNILRRIQVLDPSTFFSDSCTSPSLPYVFLFDTKNLITHCLFSTKNPITLSKNGPRRPGVKKRIYATSASSLRLLTSPASAPPPEFLQELTAKTVR